MNHPLYCLMQPPPPPVWCRTTEPRRKLLQHAVDAERTCAEHLRTWVGHYGLILCCFYCNWRRGWWQTPQQWREEADHGSSPEVPISVVRDCRSRPGPPGAPPENPPVSSQEFLLSQTNSTYLFQSVRPLDSTGADGSDGTEKEDWSPSSGDFTSHLCITHHIPKQ